MYLNNHTYFSLRYGTLSIRQLIDHALRNGLEELVLTDINSTSAVLEFIRLCKKAAIRPVVGIDFRNNAQQEFIGIAKNNEGFLELNRFLSNHLCNKTPIPAIAPEFKNCTVIYPFGKSEKLFLKPNEFIGIRPDEVQRVNYSPVRHISGKLVILSPLTFLSKQEYNTHLLLRAIDNNTLLSKLHPSQKAAENDCFIQAENLLKSFELFPEIISNTKKIICDSHIDFKFGTSKNKELFGILKEEDTALLREETYRGMRYRYGTENAEAKQRIEKELEMISRLGFNAYFLIARDIVNYAQSKGYDHVGRGSGANSIVAYCLRITDVDPIDLDLYFERFINQFRSSPPDFDIDFSWKDRDDITRYIFEKYGTEHTVLLATYNTFREKAARRELGKVFGLPKEEIDRLDYTRQNYRPGDRVVDAVYHYAALINGFPNYLSVHAGGILISEKPIHYFTATELPPKGFPITQFDMISAEDIGLYKFDILSQRGLGHIRDCATIVKQNRGIEVDVHNISAFKVDPKIKDLVKNGKTMGCFYVESPAMRMLLSKLKCEDYKTLVAASSIIRPGVARSGMMREYIQRFHHPNGYKVIHPKMNELMKETFGVMVYQEDVIKVAHHFAGLTLAESDILRRGMSGKYRSRAEFKRLTEKFMGNCLEKGYPEAITKEVWRQIESFAGYSFSKAHSASYAVESYQSLFLKAHFPKEFMVAVINNFGGFYRTEFYVHEARMAGANIRHPDINLSKTLTCIKGNDIYLGFIHLKSLERKTVKNLLRERETGGVYLSFGDFIDRTFISLEQVLILIRARAFDAFDSNKKQLIVKANLLLQRRQVPAGDYPSPPELFTFPRKKWELPVLHHHPIEDAYDDIELIGFSLTNPFDLLIDNIEDRVKARDLESYHRKTVIIYGYLVTIKNTVTIKKDRMQFGTFLDSEGYFFDTIHFPNSVKRYPFRGRGVYRIKGKVSSDFGFYSIEVITIRKMPILPDPRYD